VTRQGTNTNQEERWALDRNMAAQAKAMHALIDEGSGAWAGSAARYLLDIYKALTQEAPPNEILILRLSRAADDA